MPHQAGHRRGHAGRRSSNSIQRQHLEAGIILLSGARLVAAVAALRGGIWHAAWLAAVHLLALLLEFRSPASPGSPYHLRSCESQGISQGVLAVPSVLAALAVAAPSGSWLVWLQGACAAAAATLATIYAQSAALRRAGSRSHAIAKAAAAAAAAEDEHQHARPSRRPELSGAAREAPSTQRTSTAGYGKAAGTATRRPNASAINHWSSSNSANNGSSSMMIAGAAAGLAVLLAVGSSTATTGSSRAAALSTWLQHQATVSQLARQQPGLLAALLGAALAPLCFCTIMQLLPGCFSLGEGGLMAAGAAGLLVAAGSALPSAAAFVPPAVCQRLPSSLLEQLAAAGGCSAAAHAWALSLQGLPAAVVLILAAVLALCLALRLLKAAAGPSQGRGKSGGKSGGKQHHSNCSSSGSSSSSGSNRLLDLAGRLLFAGLLCAGMLLLLSWLAAAAAWTLAELLPARPWRVAVLAYWAGLLGITLPALKLWAGNSSMPQIIVRKVYHLLAGALFVPAFFWDLQLLALSLAIGFAALVLLEVLRHLRLPGVGRAVQQFMQDFVDERDSGVIYVTHFTLLLGLAVPIWLCLGLPGLQAFASAATHHRGRSTQHAAAAPAAAGQDFRLLLVTAGLSGMVIIGVGDTAASAVGRLLGRIPIHKGSQKTVEGTIAGIASSLGAWCLLLWCSGLAGGGSAWWMQLVLATAGAGLMEAATSQLDNVLLPLWYLPHLLLVHR